MKLEILKYPKRMAYIKKLDPGLGKSHKMDPHTTKEGHAQTYV